jgi:hypothetical protein
VDNQINRGRSCWHSMRDRYIALRRRYQPETTKLAIVAESPPASGRYFYDETGPTTEPLFAAVMKQLGLRPVNKAEGLRALQQAGWVLVDATYEPVNALKSSDRDAVLLRDYPLLREDLKALAPERIVLIKKMFVRCWSLSWRLTVCTCSMLVVPSTSRVLAGRVPSTINSRRSLLRIRALGRRGRPHSQHATYQRSGNHGEPEECEEPDRS